MTDKDFINVVVVYDVASKRDAKLHKRLSETLYWEQKSLFLGEIGKRGDFKIMTQINGIIDPEEDSVIIYKLRYPWVASLERWGKRPPSMNFLD